MYAVGIGACRAIRHDARSRVQAPPGASSIRADVRERDAQRRPVPARRTALKMQRMFDPYRRLWKPAKAGGQTITALPDLTKPLRAPSHELTDSPVSEPLIGNQRTVDRQRSRRTPQESDIEQMAECTAASRNKPRYNVRVDHSSAVPRYSLPASVASSV